MRPSGSISRTSLTRSRSASACASAPPSGPAPMIATILMRSCLVYAGRMVAIVTGGSKGIGLAIARAFVGRGMQVAITGRHEGDLSRAADDLAGGGNVLT